MTAGLRNADCACTTASLVPRSFFGNPNFPSTFQAALVQGKAANRHVLARTVMEFEVSSDCFGCVSGSFLSTSRWCSRKRSPCSSRRSDSGVRTILMLFCSPAPLSERLEQSTLFPPTSVYLSDLFAWITRALSAWLETDNIRGGARRAISGFNRSLGSCYFARVERMDRQIYHSSS